jgi:aminoglycoside N3'-acetyltransferase
MIKKLDKFFFESGLYQSKYIYIYSDFRIFFSFYKVKSNFHVKKILELFTKKGITCVVPAFSYTTEGKFNVKKTKSGLGFLSNFILKNLNHERSEHPLFSFIAIGKNKRIVRNIGLSAFGKNSLHERLYKKNAFFLNFFRPIEQGNTLVHHIEQINKAEYRFDKRFNTRVYKNNKFIKTGYRAYLRKFVDNKDHFFTFKKLLKKIKNKRLFHEIKLYNSGVKVYNYDKFYDELNYFYSQDNEIFIKKNA